MSYSKLPVEVRCTIHSLLTPVYEEESFNIKNIEERDDDDGETEHEDAYLTRINHEMRQLFLVPYLKQFEAIIECGGGEDYIDYDIYTAESLGYFLRSGITHFGRFTCDYETGYDLESSAGKFASGTIEVSINEEGEVKVSGGAVCDDESWGKHEWEWFAEIEREIKQWIQQDDLGLISWQLMEHIDGALEGEIEDLRARSGGDEEEDEDTDESGNSDDENETDDDDSSATEESDNE
jgi:hypothetical protein